MTASNPPGSPGDSNQPFDPAAPIDYPEPPAYSPQSSFPPPAAYPPPPAYPPPAPMYPPPVSSYPPPVPPYPPAPPSYPPAAPGYPGNFYDPYRQATPSGTNGLAIGSLVTSILGTIFGIPLTLLCWIGFLVPVVGVILGVVSLNQIKTTGQSGRGMAIAGIVVGAVGLVLIVGFIVIGIIALASSSSYS